MTDERLQKWLKVLKEPNAEMSKIAADKLGEIGDKAAVPALLETLRTRAAFVAGAAALALGKIGDKSAVKDLIHAMQTHQDVVVRTAAAEALGEMRAIEAIPALKAVCDEYLKTYQHDRFNLTRGMERGLFTTAIYALRQIGTPQAIRIANQAESAG